MMMNFLDLSAASDEERRRIEEILSDTSVVNFASEPVQDTNHHHHQNQQHHQVKSNHQQQQQQPAQLPQNQIKKSLTAPLHYNQQQQQQQQQQKPASYQLNHTSAPILEQPIATPTTPNSPATPIPATTTTSNATSNTTNPIITNESYNSATSLDHVNSHIDSTQTNLHHPQVPTAVVPTAKPLNYFAPPPPPPTHVYSGPPIFQPYPHYLIPYNLPPPYPMSYVLPPTNSVVPTRQQVPPQSNQPPNSTLAPNSHSRPHTHHLRTNKLKDAPKLHHVHHQQSQPQTHHHQQQQHQYQHQQHPHHQHHHQQHQQQLQMQMQPQIQQSYQNNLEAPRRVLKVVPEQNFNENHYEPNSSQQEHFQADPNELQDTNNVQPTTSTMRTQPIQDYHQPNQLADNNKQNIEEEIVRVSSDEGFDTQSSLDVSKQSHESSLPASDQSKSPGEQKRNTSDNETSCTESQETVQAVEKCSNNLQQQNQDKGPWGSAASKSWASLFKGDSQGLAGLSINGETEHNNLSETENYDGDSKLQRLSKVDIGIKSNHTAVASEEQKSQQAVRRALDKMAVRLAQKINSITLKHSLPLLRPRGFINKGNGCYINSTLQALIACPPFYNLMKEIGDLRGIGRENSCTPILDSFAELFLNFLPLDTNKKNKQSNLPDQRMQMNSLLAEAIEPKCIYNVLGKIKSECLRGAQEDAEEFLSSVLNGLHEEMIGLSETLQSSQVNSSNQNGHQSDCEDITGDLNNDDNLWREVGPKNRSLPIRTAPVINTPIQEIFGGSLFSIRTAGKDRCGHRSPFFDLQLDISGDNVKSLQDAIKSFTASEIIQDFYCSKTKQKLDAQRRTSLDQLPPILILHLKQFVYTQDHGLRKLMKKIEYPIDFELPDSCLHDKNSDKSLRNSRTYKLLAVVYHEGKEAYKGHYLTDVYHIGSSQWIRCDDSNLKVVPLPRIENPESSRTPYLLFYRRLNTLRPPQLNNKKQ